MLKRAKTCYRDRGGFLCEKKRWLWSADTSSVLFLIFISFTFNTFFITVMFSRCCLHWFHIYLFCTFVVLIFNIISHSTLPLIVVVDRCCIISCAVIIHLLLLFNNRATRPVLLARVHSLSESVSVAGTTMTIIRR